LDLRVTGRRTAIVVSGSDAAAKELLSSLESRMPELDRLLGPFPYEYIDARVVTQPELPAGVGYTDRDNVWIREDAVSTSTATHELTHLYIGGRQSAWFLEGVAHFFQYYLTGDLDEWYALSSKRLDQSSTSTLCSAPSLTLDRLIGITLLTELYRGFGLAFVRDLALEMKGKEATTPQILDAMRSLVNSGADRDTLERLLASRLTPTVKIASGPDARRMTALGVVPCQSPCAWPPAASTARLPSSVSALGAQRRCRLDAGAQGPARSVTSRPRAAALDHPPSALAP
jgi:hypothetical protein